MSDLELIEYLREELIKKLVRIDELEGMLKEAAIHVRPTCTSFYDEIMEVLGEGN